MRILKLPKDRLTFCGRLMSSSIKPKFFLALDFEATCDSPAHFEPQEIIEFPAILVNSDSFEVLDSFHQYVRPLKQPQLTPFCSSLTDITQEMVDQSEDFSAVWSRFEQWLLKHELINESSQTLDGQFAFVTCGNWDLGVMLPDQLSISGIVAPAYTKQWINIKAIFKRTTGKWPKSLADMLHQLDLQFVGRPHNGYDDAMNVVNIARELSKKNAQFPITNVIK